MPIAGAGPEKDDAMITAMGRLFELGHRRIVLLTRRVQRLPKPGSLLITFLNELTDHGITPSDYNLPDWEESVEGFHEGLEALFRVTPPTALIVDEVKFFLAAQQFCASRNLRIPEDVSLICTDDDPHFDWFTPYVSHIWWDRTLVIRQVERWAANVSIGKEDHRQIFTNAKFIEGGTIGPVA